VAPRGEAVRLGLIVFARLDSRRLPGKALRALAGRPLLGRALDRVHAVAPPVPIVVATSDRALDDQIAAFAGAKGVLVFRGSTDDVAGRAAACARQFGFDAFVRISGDSPFVDPKMIGAFVARFIAAGDLDVLTTVMTLSFPPGASIEVISLAALQRALDATNDADDREHVTRYFYRHPERFRIENVAAARSYMDLSLTVDTPADLARADFIMAHLGAAAAVAPLDEICALARRYDEAHPATRESSLTVAPS